MKAISGWILTILGPDEDDEANVKVEEILVGRALGDAEDVINDHLPDGYSAKISEAALVR